MTTAATTNAEPADASRSSQQNARQANVSISSPVKQIQGNEDVVEVTSDSAMDDDASPSQNSSQENKYPTGFKFWLLMFNLGAVIALYALDMSIVSTAVPRITDHFHTVADVGWYSVAFRLGQCAFQFLYATEQQSLIDLSILHIC